MTICSLHVFCVTIHTMLISDPISTTWQALSALSELGLVIIAILGLRQLSLAKKGLQQSAQLARKAALRESYKLAADQCHSYAGDIVPLIDKCDSELKSLGMNTVLDSFSIQLIDNGIQIKAPSPFPLIFKNDPSLWEKVVRSTLPVHNALEAFSVMFTEGIAAEEVAFSSVGRSFCFNVKRHAPLIIHMQVVEIFQAQDIIKMSCNYS